MRLLVHANGFDYPFKSQLDEIRCGAPLSVGGHPDCEWSPSSVDFKALGDASGGSEPAADIDDLLHIVEKQKPGSITDLRILGHADETRFALGGIIQPDNVYFDKPEAVISYVLIRNIEPQFHKLRDRFEERGTVTLVGCNSGASGAAGLLEVVSRTFLCCAQGFHERILWNIDVNFPPAAEHHIDNRWRITRRGLVFANIAGLDEAALTNTGAPGVPMTTNAWDLHPDSYSSVGQRVLDVATGKGGMHKLLADSVLGKLPVAGELGFQLIKDFLPNAPSNLIVASDPILKGLRVEIKGKETFIIVGAAFRDNFSPATFDQRLEEMRLAVNLAAAGKPGFVPMK